MRLQRCTNAVCTTVTVVFRAVAETSINFMQAHVPMLSAPQAEPEGAQITAEEKTNEGTSLPYVEPAVITQVCTASTFIYFRVTRLLLSKIQQGMNLTLEVADRSSDQHTNLSIICLCCTGQGFV